uniref:Omega-6 fatty acid desaturase, endoplasmic reticulum isozyme 2 n=1 Tax=Anthurium amnicola TaxID=1678845 RepID=A0A1D1YEF5_9ARAE
MGAGGRNTAEEKKAQDPYYRRAPSDRPPFTLADLKNAIPPHCFHHSAIRSFSYLARDLVAASALFYLAIAIIPLLPVPLRLLAWPLYWFAQGNVFTGVWVIAHECGHQAFSDYGGLNDAVGWVLHSSLLVPYFSWKHSHRRHHANTGSMDTDEVYIPKSRSTLPWYLKLLLKSLPGRFLYMVLSLAFGWPAYLAFNISGRTYPRWASHFDPYSPIYSRRKRVEILLSDVGLLGMPYALFRLARTHSWGWVASVYGVPVFYVNVMVVLITLLHHTHLALPHYDSSEWEWLRGALSTVDRDFGFLNGVFHHVADTHVLHHLFSTVPHYHALEATQAIKPVLGDYYQSDATHVLRAIWREATNCIYVEPDEGGKPKGILWYRNKI